MRQQDLTRVQSHVVSKMFLRLLVCLCMLLAAISPSQAEIYRWKDESGVIHYSNALPASGISEVLDVIPTHRIPIVEDADGQVYYLNLPGSELTQDMAFQDVLDQLRLPDDILDELMEEAAAAKLKAEHPSTVAFRLTELEEALEREMTKRLEWEQEYLRSQSRSKELQLRNEQLQLALGALEARIDSIQKALALSDRHASAMKEPQRRLGKLERQVDALHTVLTKQDSTQQFGQLSRKIVQLQAFLTKASRQSQEDAAELSSTLDSVKAEQGLLLASLSGRVDTLATGLERVQQQSLAEKFDLLSREMQRLKASLPSKRDNTGQLQARLEKLEAAHEQQIKNLERKLQSLETRKRTEAAQVDALAERVAAFGQQSQDETVHVKLAGPESSMAALTDAAGPDAQSISTLTAISADQSDQLRQQQMQIALLRHELEQLKRHSVPQKTGHDKADGELSGKGKITVVERQYRRGGHKVSSFWRVCKKIMGQSRKAYAGHKAEAGKTSHDSRSPH
ncbi:hypothetical protein CSB45_04620 [candidate division KSB3 bacterium]|uniref:DUF4124 domain-containing protein n=1 Tax=candidate division KSB3 bacterium TaxID=2044937 RepID=A0A2G6E8D4_9BACT|nr:MAG: hypothetical protein CSB45_04620 [candidate division KSB3 bacterium]PIE30660.1 MAG: hypothetical protein CSA57_03205 [candidate division KSB3 bacterium]